MAKKFRYFYGVLNLVIPKVVSEANVFFSSRADLRELVLDLLQQKSCMLLVSKASYLRNLRMIELA